MSNIPSDDSWLESGSDAPATATKTAVAGKTFWIFHISASYDTAQNGTLELRQGATVIATWNVKTELVFDFRFPIPIRGGDASLVLSGVGDTDATQHVKVVMGGMTD